MSYFNKYDENTNEFTSTVAHVNFVAYFDHGQVNIECDEISDFNIIWALKSVLDSTVQTLGCLILISSLASRLVSVSHAGVEKMQNSAFRIANVVPSRFPGLISLLKPRSFP